MENLPTHRDARTKADSHLRELLNSNHGRSAEDIAHSITALALEEGNAVRDFFAIINGTLNLSGKFWLLSCLYRLQCLRTPSSRDSIPYTIPEV